MKDDKGIMKELNDYCEKYSIPIEFVVKVISDLKVIPMIRGKAFEFTVSSALKDVLPENKWTVSNPVINAQSEVHDLDVSVIRKSDNKEIRIECKLAGKDSFKTAKGDAVFKIKCMRSRTISENEVATRMARKYGIDRELVLLHRDNYREDDFDFVIASLGNAFWTTVDKMYISKGTEEQHKLLSKLFPDSFTDFNKFKNESFNFLLFADSKKIKVSKENNVICRRKGCIKSGKDKDCGFIPNYPVVNLVEVAEGKSIWKTLSQINEEFSRF